MSPQRPLLRLDGHGYSPGLLQQIVTAGGRSHSFADAALALALCGLSISARHVRQLAHAVGTGLARTRDERALRRRRRQRSPRVEVTPEGVAVGVDGGRPRARAPDDGRGVHQAENKEDKIACLVTWTSSEHAADPQPEPPPSFVQPRRMQRLVPQRAGQAGGPIPGADTPPASPGAGQGPAPPTAAVVGPQAEPWAPRRLVRTGVAGMVAGQSFGPLRAAAAQSRAFDAARRKAFVADGRAYSWSIHRGYSAAFVPIVDLLHVVCYLLEAAQAAEPGAGRWPSDLRWRRACWQGRAAEVVQQLEVYPQRVGRPPPGEALAATDRRRLLAEALS